MKQLTLGLNLDIKKTHGCQFLEQIDQVWPLPICPKTATSTSTPFGDAYFWPVLHENGIIHKLTKPYNPLTNGQSERVNRTIKQANIKAFHHPDLESLQAHVLAFVCAFNFANHLKTLR